MKLQASIATIAVVLSLAFQLAHGLRLFRSHAAIGRKAGLVLKSSSSDVASSYAAIKNGIIAEFRSKQSATSPPAAAAATASQLAPFVAEFLDDYANSCLAAGCSPRIFQENIVTFLRSVESAIAKPFHFNSFHKAVREPFDFYKWGNDFLKPMVIMESSELRGLENAQRIQALLSQGDNVILLSNHQTEADPQVISILLERAGLASLAEQMIFIAGHKVTSDPVAIPFSMGRNLICIHSKKHIKNPPELAAEKQAQNLASMKALGDLVNEGGHVFWVAPSGGRDRPNEHGDFEVSSFDGKALDMFKMVAMQSSKITHFFPMAMHTHQLVPPPKTVSSGLGEARSAKRGSVSVAFLQEMDGLGGLRDKAYAEDMQRRVEEAYAELTHRRSQ